MPTEKAPLDKGTLREQYDELVRRGETHSPGINDLLSLFQRQQEGLKQSQEFLQLFRQIFTSSTSNSSQ
jgi:hypothetical protein